MRLLPEEVPLPSSPEVSAVRGRQRAVPSDPLVHRCMAEKFAARQKSIPYGGVAKRRRRSHTASTSPELSSGDQRDMPSRASIYCGSYGETSDSSSSCSGRIFSNSCGDRLPCSCERFPWDHTGGRPPFTQGIHWEHIENNEVICLSNTQGANFEFVLNVPTTLITLWSLSKFWIWSQRTHQFILWVFFQKTLGFLS